MQVSGNMHFLPMLIFCLLYILSIDTSKKINFLSSCSLNESFKCLRAHVHSMKWCQKMVSSSGPSGIGCYQLI